ncbi:MAG: Ig-like domain-containing protein [Thermoleophilia bacterium]|nr:Ig-like domain-containing protein [Thermoleophilia bacterium]
MITGMSYEQSVRPYKAEDPTLTAAAAVGDTTLALSSVAKFQHTCAGGGTCDNVFIGIGLGTESIEVRQIASIDPATSTVTLTQPLSNAHPVGDAAGTEFTQYRWYPDVLLDNIFWHDHVDGIHNWGHGLVGQLIIEPKGSTYHDPKTGEVVDSGTIVDIHTSNPLVQGVVNGSFREMALWTIDENPNTDATLNLKAEPWADRLLENPDQSLLFSSYTHGDPITPLPLAYPGDSFVIRTINVGPTVDGLHIDGHRFSLENRYFDAGGKQEALQLDTLKYGISEKYTLVLQGGAGGPQHQPGDYLYENSIDRKFRDGAWGLIRVLPGQSSDLLPLPGTSAPPSTLVPVQSGGRPPDTGVAGNPCPAAAPVKHFTVSAVDVSLSNGVKGPAGAFVNGSPVSPITFKPDPLVLHVAAGDCVEVAFTNKRTVRSSFHVGMLLHSPDSSGIDAGYNSEQTVATGQSRTYRYYADGDRYETGLISDYGVPSTVPDPLEPGPVDPARDGMYGAIEVAPAGATFTDTVFGTPVNVGPNVIVHLPGKTGYRDFTLMLGESDEKIGQNQMPYPVDVHGDATINYDTAGPRVDGPSMFSSAANGGDPETMLLRSYPGDPIRVHAIVAPGSEQQHTFNLGGLSWPIDPGIPEADSVETLGVVPQGVVEAHVTSGSVGDYFYGDLRRPFTVAGMWGLQRVFDPLGCPILGLDGRMCGMPLAAPTVTLTDPAVGATVSGDAVTVAATASDASGIANVQFQLDGVNLGSPDSSAPYSISWNTKLASDGPHVLAAIATNNNGVSSTASIPVAVDNTPPVVSLTAPLTGATVSGAAVSVTADASDNNVLAGVQFKVDGGPLGAEDTSAPFSASWDSTAVADGSHTLTAVARDTAGNTASSSVTVTVSNAVAPPPPAPPAYIFGSQTVQPKIDSNAPGVAEAFKTTTANSGSVTQLRVYVDAGSTATSLVVGLYSNSATNHPGTRLTTGTLSAPVAGQFNTVTVPAAGVTAGQTYWVAILGPSGTLKFRDQGAVAAGSSEVSSTTGLTAMPTTWTSGASFSDGRLSAWAAGTLTTTPPPPPPPPPPAAGTVLVGNAATEAKIDSNAAGQAEAFKATAAATGSVSQLRVYLDAGSTASSVVVGLYSNNAGHPGALLTSGTISAPAAGQNNTVTVSGASVTAGQTYWIAVLGPSGTIKFRDRGAVGAGSSETSQQATLTSLPATWTTGTSFADGLISAVGIG